MLRQDSSGMPTATQLQRVALEAPEQLVPVLRRAAWKMVRRRIGRWLRQHLLARAPLEQRRRESPIT